MGYSSSLLQKQPEPLWRLFYRPMLVISLVVHGLVFAIPLPSEPEVVTEAEAEETVDLASLSALRRPLPQPTPEALPSPLSPQPTSQAPPSPIQPLAAPPVQLPPTPAPNPIPSPEASPSPIASPPPETVSPEVSPAPETATDPVEEEPFSDFFAQFQGNLQGMGSVEGLGIPVNFFEEPQAFFADDSLQPGSDPEPLAGNENVLWFSLKRPPQVYEQLQGVFAGYAFSELGEYGGGALYEVSQGDRTFYLSLVPGNSSINTFAVFWSRNPTEPIETNEASSADNPAPIE